MQIVLRLCQMIFPIPGRRNLTSSQYSQATRGTTAFSRQRLPFSKHMYVRIYMHSFSLPRLLSMCKVGRLRYSLPLQLPHSATDLCPRQELHLIIVS